MYSAKKSSETAKYIFAFIMLATIAVGCSSRSVLPDQKSVKVSRDNPTNSACKEIGTVSGLTLSKVPSEAEALEDLKKEADRKGANYVVVKQYSETGGAVTGVAYECP